MQAVQVIQEEIDIPFVSCLDCCAIWHSADCERCPRCARQVGIHCVVSEEQIRLLMYAVSLLSEERILRASEYETWAFGEILREHMPSYTNTCRVTIQACYMALCMQPSNLKNEFAIEFFKEAYLQAPEIETYRDEEEDHYNSDVDEWW
jgi:hypothetical protein